MGCTMEKKKEYERVEAIFQQKKKRKQKIKIQEEIKILLMYILYCK